MGRWAYWQRPFHEGGVMDWQQDLDALIESTMAFAGQPSERSPIRRSGANYGCHYANDQANVRTR